MAWTGGIKWSGQILTWAATILVARILMPADYGMVAMAGAFTAITTMIADFGIDMVVMHFRDLTRRQISELHTTSLLLGAGGFLLSMLISLPASWYFNVPELQWVIVVSAINFLFKALKTVPAALLQQAMRFKFLAIAEGIQTIIQAVAVITLAWLGFSYWALVIGNLLGPPVALAMILSVQKQSFAWPQMETIRQYISYSWHVLSSRLAWVLYTNADTFVVGRLLGQASLGLYSFGLTLANVAVDKIAGLSSQVTSPLFSAVQNDHTAIRRYLLMLTEGCALVSFPLTIGLALVADTLVPFVFGNKWDGMIVPLQILSATASYRSIASLPSQVLFAIKDSTAAMWNGFLGVILLPLGFVIGSHWGIIGVSLVWGCVHPPFNYHLSTKLFKSIGLSHGEYWRALLPATTATGIMAAVVLGAHAIMPENWSPAIRLLAEIGLGGVSYLAVVWSIHQERVRAFIRLIRN